MRRPFTIEDIEALRTQQGIDDVELRDQIRGLRVGDVTKITLLAGVKSSETLPVRITRIDGRVFRGKFTRDSALAGLSTLRAGSSVIFAATHIHSILKQYPAPPARRPGTPSLEQGACRHRTPLRSARRA